MFILQNILLCSMLLTYINLIIIVYQHYNNNYSISEIITNDIIKYKIFFWSLLMAIFTIVYEFYRSYYSLLIIIFLLLGIIGVIFTKENRAVIFTFHNFFSCIAFFSINIFMFFHAYNKSNIILYLLFLFQTLLILLTFKNIKIKIFYYECIILFNFFIFYMYLHLLK